MDEPSVLDYVKAKIKFWEKTDLSIPRFVEAQPPAQDVTGSAVDTLAGGLEGERDAAPITREAVHFPWLALLPVVTALAAQSFLEPPNRFAAGAVILYLLTAVLAVVAYLRGDLLPAEAAHAAPKPDSLDFRWGQVLMGLPLAFLAFILFRGNHFSPVNVTLWLASLGLFLYGFVQFQQPVDITGWLRRKWGALRAPGAGWDIHISRWALLVIAVLAVVAFFRFYHLDTLPVDMISDHAEKLLDINDLLNGKSWIFFERNTGREPFQFYWTALVIKLFGLDVSFFSLKLGTALTGLVVLYYTYRLGALVGNRWVALMALFFVGIAYWANIISRIALRFPLYPFFVAPLLFHLIRGLRTGSRNDFLWVGLWLGIGLNGYTSSRVVPFLVVIAVLLYIAHRQSRGYRAQALMGLMLIAFLALVICLPLIRYTLEHPEMVLYRSFTRLGDMERPLPGAPLEIFASNFWAVITMFFYDNGSIWVHSIPFRPALDLVMAALFFVGVVLLLARYIKKRSWEDIFLLVSIPILLLPSALSLAFPGENPSLNRTAGAYVPVLVIAALGLEALLRGLAQRIKGPFGRTFAIVIGALLLLWTLGNNYNLFFVQYNQNYRQNAWNTREIGGVVRDFAGLAGTYDTYYVVGFPYWIDSRQVAIFAGHIQRDPAILPERFGDTLAETRMKMFILKPEDAADLEALRKLYPEGRAELQRSPQPQKDFLLFLVPAMNETLP